MSDGGRAGPDWQGRLLPRSALGMSVLLLAAAIGAAFSGAVFYAYYEYRLDTNESAIEKYAADFDERLATAVATIEAEEAQAKDAVRSELEPLQKIAASGETVSQLLDDVEDSVWLLTTQGEDGRPSVGSAFVVFADGDRSFLLTSYAALAAATRQPGPEVSLRKGGDTFKATVESFEPGRDLALVSIGRPNLPRLEWADGEPSIGERVFAVSGLGGSGSSASQGLVGDISTVGIQHDAPVGPQFQGGPLLNSAGEVVGVASRAYSPSGFAADAVWFAPVIRAACEQVIRCP